MSTALSSLWRGGRRPLRVLASFPHAAYLEVGEVVVALVSRDGIHQPNAAVLSEPSTGRPLEGLVAGQQGSVGDARLRVGVLEIWAARWWDPRPRLAPCPPARLTVASRVSMDRARADADLEVADLTGPLADVAAALLAGDEPAARLVADGLIGLGPGLTPAGDDALAGLVAGTVLLAPAVAAGVGAGVGPDAPSASADLATRAQALGSWIASRARTRTTPVSVGLLRCAADGQVAAPVAGLLRSWTSIGASAIEVHAATGRVLEIGSTSGRDLLLGLEAAARVVLAPGAEPLTAAVARQGPGDGGGSTDG